MVRLAFVPRARYYVHMRPGDVTEQGTTNAAFDDDDRAVPVAQVNTDGGTRNARMEIGPGFYTAPVPGERVQVTEQDGCLYGVGGINVAALKSLAPVQGERGCFAVDDNGDVVAHIRLRPDGTLHVVTTATTRVEAGGGFIELDGSTGQCNINGNFTVDK